VWQGVRIQQCSEGWDECGGGTQGMEVKHVCDVMGQVCRGGVYACKQTQIWMWYTYKRLILK